jgi:hypothetical protein
MKKMDLEEIKKLCEDADISPLEVDGCVEMQAPISCRQAIALIEEVERLKSWKDEVNEAARATMEEACFEDEKHCTCVPLLKMKCKGLKAEVERLRKELALYKPQQASSEVHVFDSDGKVR